MEALLQPFPMRPGRRAQAWRHHPAYWRPRHFHAEPEINLVRAGHARIAVGSKEHALGPGEFVVLAPGQDHALLQASDDLDLFVVALEPELTERALGSAALRSAGRGALDPATLERSSDLLDTAARDGEDVEARPRLVELFSRLQGAVGPTHATGRRAMGSLLATPSVSAGGLAARLSTSPAELSRTFQGAFGVPFVEMRARHRLLRFVDAVDRGSSFSRAALDAGFGSYAQLHRVFARHLGTTPRAYFGGQRVSIDGALRWPAQVEQSATLLAAPRQRQVRRNR